jgi:hypothetical protein
MGAKVINISDIITNLEKKLSLVVDENGEPISDNIRYHFIGEKGAASLDAAEEATTRMDNLRTAREMETAKKDARTIKLATGWERGADGKWRYEILDFKLSDKVYEESMRMNREKLDRVMFKLGDMIDDNDLFAAYPQLKNIEVHIDKYDSSSNSGGHYNPKGFIKINRFSPRLENDLEHEIQHAIQRIEGFARGGNPNQFTQQNNKADILDEIYKAQRIAFNKIPEKLQNDARRVNRGEDTDGSSMKRIQANPIDKEAWSDYIRALESARYNMDLPDELFNGLTPEEQCIRHNGNQRARDETD